jgi:hypothetical protein
MEGRGKERETSVRVGDVAAEIRKEHLPNACLDLQRQTKMFNKTIDEPNSFLIR